MGITANEKRRMRWIKKVLDFLPDKSEEGVTVNEIYNNLNDPSESTIRGILIELKASEGVNRTITKPWKWNKVNGKA